MCKCREPIDRERLSKCRALAELWSRGGVGACRYVGGGKFRWGVVWRGLPAPIVWLWPVWRYLLASNLGRSASDLPRRIDFNVGCGCVDWLRGVYERLFTPPPHPPGA